MLTNVDMLIKELCRETGEPEYRNYDSFVGHIRRGYSQLNIAAVQTVKYEYIPINAYNALDWPCGCLKVLAVSLNRNDTLITLSLDTDLVPQQPTQATDLSGTAQTIDEILNSTYGGYRFDVSGNGEIYSLGCGFNAAGFVRNDKSTRQSYVKGAYLEDDTFLMTYLHDGISDGLEFVPVETENCLRAFCLSEYYRVKNPGLSQIETKRFREEVTFLNKFYNAGTADDWREVFRQNEKSSPK